MDCYRIDNVTCGETRTGLPRWVIHFSDGLQASTLNKSVGNIATMLANEGTPVYRTLEVKGQWTNLVGLKPVPRDARPAQTTPAVEVAEQDILF